MGIRDTINALTVASFESRARANEAQGKSSTLERFAADQFRKAGAEISTTQVSRQSFQQAQNNAEIAASLSNIENLLIAQAKAREEQELKRIAKEKARWEASPEGQAELARREEERLQREAEQAEERRLARELKKERRREAKKAQRLAAERKEREAPIRAAEAEARKRDHEEYQAKLRAERAIKEKQEQEQQPIAAKQEKATRNATASKQSGKEQKEGGLMSQIFILLIISAALYFLVPISPTWVTYGMYGFLGLMTLGFCGNVWDKLMK